MEEINKQDIKTRLKLSAFIKYFLLFVAAGIFAWKIFEFRINLTEINEILKNTNTDLLIEFYEQTKETLIKDFIIDIIWLISVTTVLLIQIMISESNTENINILNNAKKYDSDNLK